MKTNMKKMIIVALVLFSMNAFANDNKKIVKNEVAIEVKNTEVKKEVKNLDMSEINAFLECNDKHKNLDALEESNMVLKLVVDKLEAELQEKIKNKAVK